MKHLIKKKSHDVHPLLKSVSVLVLWLCAVKCLCFCFIGLNFKVCRVVQSLVLNHSVLLSLCVSCHCTATLKNRCVGKDHHQKVINLTLPTFVPIYPKEFDNP